MEQHEQQLHFVAMSHQIMDGELSGPMLTATEWCRNRGSKTQLVRTHQLIGFKVSSMPIYTGW